MCIARLDLIKGHKFLLAAWKLLKDRGHGYQLDLVGEGPLRAELEAQSVRDGTQGLIRFCGYTPNVTRFIDTSLFAILVSRVEGQGIVTLEAAAMGRPSILTAVPGSIDLIPPRRKLKNGLQFGNVEEMAQAVEEWFANPEEVIREGEVFFHFVKSSSDPSMIAQAYTKLYEHIMLGSSLRENVIGEPASGVPEKLNV